MAVAPAHQPTLLATNLPYRDRVVLAARDHELAVWAPAISIAADGRPCGEPARSRTYYLDACTVQNYKKARALPLARVALRCRRAVPAGQMPGGGGGGGTDQAVQSKPPK